MIQGVENFFKKKKLIKKGEEKGKDHFKEMYDDMYEKYKKKNPRVLEMVFLILLFFAYYYNVQFQIVDAFTVSIFGLVILPEVLEVIEEYMSKKPSMVLKE